MPQSFTPYELVLILEAYLRHRSQGSTLRRAAEALSERLRAGARAKGMTINETWRNVAGMSHALAMARDAIEGRNQERVTSRLYYVLTLRRMQPQRYQQLLAEAVEMFPAVTHTLGDGSNVLSTTILPLHPHADSSIDDDDDEAERRAAAEALAKAKERRQRALAIMASRGLYNGGNLFAAEESQRESQRQRQEGYVEAFIEERIAARGDGLKLLDLCRKLRQRLSDAREDAEAPPPDMPTDDNELGEIIRRIHVRVGGCETNGFLYFHPEAYLPPSAWLWLDEHLERLRQRGHNDAQMRELYDAIPDIRFPDKPDEPNTTRLQAALRKHFPQACLEKGFIYLNGAGKTGKAKIGNEVAAYLREEQRLVQSDEIIGHFRGRYSPADIKRGLTDAEQAIRGNKCWFHLSLFDPTDEELRQAAEVMDKYIARQGYAFLTDVVAQLPKEWQLWQERVDNLTEMGVRGALVAAFKGRYCFYKALIAMPNDKTIGIEHVKQIVLDFARQHGHYTLKEFASFAQRFSEVYGYALAWVQKAVSVRINESHFIPAEEFRTPPDIVERIDQAIANADRRLDNPKGCIPLSAIDNFAAFPEVGHPWNVRLLESFLLTRSQRFTAITYDGWLVAKHAYGLIVHRGAGTFEQNAAWLLANAGVQIDEAGVEHVLKDKAFGKSCSKVPTILALARQMRQNS